MDFLKKFKFLKSKELAAGFLGCFFVGFCLALFLSLLDYRVVSGSNGRLFLSGRLGSVGPRPPTPPEFLEIGAGDCDVFRGDWVWDDSYPLYEARDCTPLGQGFRCNENGRPDASYTKWRWQPKDCNLPRFNARVMLEKLRDKRVAFVGDSLGRNQWESLLCMLSSAVPNKTSIYEVNGNPISKHMGSLIFMFKDYNCTVEYHRSPFLVFQGRPPRGAHAKVKMTIRVDKMEWRSSQWKDADLLVLNTGHWWNREKTIKLGCYFQEGSDVKMEMSAENALLRSMETLADWVNREVNLSKTHVIFRAYSPVHFSGGSWNTGGSCYLETIPDFTTPYMSSEKYMEHRSVVRGLLKNLRTEDVELLNVTDMTSRRKDGHPSVYYFGPMEGPAPLHRQDCSHWCLPGVPDSWNELLYAVFLRREISHRRF